MKTVLSIAGSDPTSGAGLQSDCLTLYQNGVYPFTVATAITTQNAHGVVYRQDLSAHLIQQQITDLFKTSIPNAIKIGMLGCVENARIIFETLEAYQAKYHIPIVLDPLIFSSNGVQLCDDATIAYLKNGLKTPLALMTPNIHEYQWLFSDKEPRFPCLITGGHLEAHARDTLISDGKRVYFDHKKVIAPFSHGTGCTLSSAIAAHLARGKTLIQSITDAKKYVTHALTYPIHFDNGYGAMRK